jgi:hypothetical protein
MRKPKREKYYHMAIALANPSIAALFGDVQSKFWTSPHFSPVFYCGGGSGHVYCVALGRAPRHTVKYACGALGN